MGEVTGIVSGITFTRLSKAPTAVNPYRGVRRQHGHHAGLPSSHFLEWFSNPTTRIDSRLIPNFIPDMDVTDGAEPTLGG